MLDAGGYDTNVANGTAILNLPTTGDYAASTHYLTLVDGYDQMPIQAVEKFKREGGEVYMNHRLESMARTRKGVRLTFVRTRKIEPKESVLHSIVNTNDRVSVDAENVVLALPRRSIELIDWAPARDNKALAAAINAVIIQVAFKMFLGYEYPWWKSLGLQAGRSITDNPIRQVFYFGTEQDAIGGEPGNTNSLLMASYNDLRSLPFWKAFENDPVFLGHDPVSGNKPGPNVPRQTHPATTGMVDMAQLLVQEIHGMRSLPAPYSAAYHDWSIDPFGGGWHAWKAGIDFRKTMKLLRKPLPDWPVHICGEAYSVQQGWVEGSYQTAELMLQEHFDLKKPTWLPKSYDLGP
jgi:monoamine oxidase